MTLEVYMSSLVSGNSEMLEQLRKNHAVLEQRLYKLEKKRAKTFDEVQESRNLKKQKLVVKDRIHKLESSA